MPSRRMNNLEIRVHCITPKLALLLPPRLEPSGFLHSHGSRPPSRGILHVAWKHSNSEFPIYDKGFLIAFFQLLFWLLPWKVCSSGGLLFSPLSQTSSKANPWKKSYSYLPSSYQNLTWTPGEKSQSAEGPTRFISGSSLHWLDCFPYSKQYCWFTLPGISGSVWSYRAERNGNCHWTS